MLSYQAILFLTINKLMYKLHEKKNVKFHVNIIVNNYLLIKMFHCNVHDIKINIFH